MTSLAKNVNSPARNRIAKGTVNQLRAKFEQNKEQFSSNVTSPGLKGVRRLKKFSLGSPKSTKSLTPRKKKHRQKPIEKENFGMQQSTIDAFFKAKSSTSETPGALVDDDRPVQRETGAGKAI